MPFETVDLINKNSSLKSDDITQLKLWIQTQHLEHKNLITFRDYFRDESNFVLCIPDFINSKHAQMISSYMIESAKYTKTYAIFSENPTTKEKWNNAGENEKFYIFSKLSGTRENKQDINAFTYFRYTQIFKQSFFINFFRYITNLKITKHLGDVHGHAFYNGDYLKAHNDRGNNKKLAFMIYMSPDWNHKYGGQLNITNNHDDIVIPYKYNQLVLFDVNRHKEHHISKINAADNSSPRLSIGGWYG